MPDKLVYSTDPAWKSRCPKCERTPCTCAVPAPPSNAPTCGEPGRTTLRLSDRQAEPLRLSFARGAKGSGVTRIDRLAANPQHKEDLLKSLKRLLGCGGAVKDGVLEIQGDHRDRIENELVALGYRVRRIGG